MAMAISSMLVSAIGQVEVLGGPVLVGLLLILLVLKERVAGSPDAAAIAFSRRLNLVLYPLLIAYCGYVLIKLVQALG